MGRSPCGNDSGLKNGPWTPEEDDKLIHYIQKHGHGSWRAFPKLAGLNRCGKSCRLRWTNYLRPDIKRGKFSQEEEQTILNLHAILGNKWSAIATHLPGRTDNEIKNFWNTHLKKKLIQMGFDPMTRRPRSDIFSSLPSLIALANLKELIENPTWGDQAMRFQAQVARMARLNQYLQKFVQPPQIQNNTTIQELPASSLLNNPSVLGHLETALPMPHPSLVTGIFHDSTCFSHLPDLQGGATLDHGGGSDFTPVLSQGENSASSTWYNLAKLSPSPPPAAALPMTETSMANMGDECSTSSYGGAQIWSELLDDPIFREIA